MTTAEYHRRLTEDGYERGAGNPIDVGICRDAVCDFCGTVGLSYEAWQHEKSYRAIAACPACGIATEF